MGKGRNKDLIGLRDEKLLKRYYYYTEVQRLRFDDTLKVLSQEEFFISEERIMAIIRKYSKEDVAIQPVKRVRMPRLTLRQLSLFSDVEGNSPAAISR